LVRGAQDDLAEVIQSPPRDLRRVIGLAGGTALIVGITIGSGIFRTPPTIAGLVPCVGHRVGTDPGWQLFADLRSGYCGGRVPRSSPLETIEEEPMRNAVVTEQAPKPIGPYSQGIIEGDFIFVAGQGCINPLTGKLELGDVRSETKRTFENLRAILQAAGSSLDHVVKCNVYLRDINDFAAMNEVYATFFAAPFPARTTIQAGALPGGIAVEIECIAKITKKAR